MCIYVYRGWVDQPVACTGPRSADASRNASDSAAYDRRIEGVTKGSGPLAQRIAAVEGSMDAAPVCARARNRPVERGRRSPPSATRATGRPLPSPGMDGPLSDITIVDLSRVLAGPYATMVLSDLGARVLKVERPGRGDDARGFGPFYGGRSVYFESLNRGKSATALDLGDPGNRKEFEQLLDGADVLVENFRPGTLDRMGYGWEVLHARWPRLVYAAVSGFGRTGPHSERPAYDMVVQAMGGLMSLTGHPGGPPTRVGTSVGDIAAGLFAAVGILSALPRTGADRAGTDGGHRHARLPGGHPRERRRPLLGHRPGSGPAGRPPPFDHPLRRLPGLRPPPGDRRRQ